MFAKFGNLLKQAIQAGVQLLRHNISVRTEPMHTSLMLGCLCDLIRSKPELIAENAFLRQQLIVLNRSHQRPRFTDTDRTLLVLLARRVRAWKQVVVIVKPDTLLRWHRQGFRLFWRRKFRAGSRAPRIPVETVALIKEMGVNNRL